MEYKIRSKPNTSEKETLLAEKRFLTKNTDPSYCIASLRNGFLVYASSTAIIRVAHVRVGEDVTESYLLALQASRIRARTESTLRRLHYLKSWKGGIDVYSRYLTNLKSRHLHLPPLAAIWLRPLTTLVYNAYQSSQLLHVCKSLLVFYNDF
ncbi:hypothetical protein GQ600_23668 [Phytophthora cactorum]|nr:hypothetical protein GQ600_23668 [Phytophthora cactorum]